jgi:ABC-type dipeptide/oligopeptide/nickel transport system permease subunit
MHVHNALARETQEPRDPILTRWRRAVVRFSRQRPLGAAGAAIIVLMILCAIAAPGIAPYHPLETDFAAQLSPPDAQHWLGTDAFGRDLLSRLGVKIF